jgi:hypothetical protein
MTASPAPRVLQQFVEDELLRAPLLFDQLIESTIDHARRGLPELANFQRSATVELMQALQAQRQRMSEYFLHSLREQTSSELNRQTTRQPAPTVVKHLTLALVPSHSLSLVDEQEVALDVQLSHTIEAIKSVADYELRELQTFVSALVGDMEMSRDHNPFRAETFARALWASSQALPLSRGHQVNFMQHAAPSLAQLLRTSYAATTARLESMGIEPAAYRTLILPAGSRSRHGRMGEALVSPDMRVMRDSMPANFDAQPRGAPTQRNSRHSNLESVSPSQSRADRQTIELVSRLFEAMLDDDRVRNDISLLISRLQGPSMRLALRDRTLFDHDRHPLWRFINRLVYASEMTPDFGDPERLQLLKMAKSTIDQLASESEQTTRLYRWALERLEAYLQKRLSRRLTAVASQLGALQKLEEKMMAGHAMPTTLHGTLDVPQLDTVPGALMDEVASVRSALVDGEDWLEQLEVGDWVRVFMQGAWVHAQLLWAGDRREILLFGDGGSDTTWAVRRGALLMMHGNRLMKDLKQRAIVATAASRVQDQLAADSTHKATH